MLSVGPDGLVGLDRRHDVVQPLIAFVVGVVHAGRVLAGNQPRVQIREVAIVDESIGDFTLVAQTGRGEDVVDVAVLGLVCGTEKVVGG